MLKINLSRRIITITVLLVVIFGVAFLLYARIPQTKTKNERINIVASFYPLAYIATEVGGNLVSVRNLVPSGVEAHDFEPSSRDLVEIGNADTFIYNGASLEPWVGKWEQGNSPRPRRIINMADALKEQGVNLVEKNGTIDPHFWLDPIIMKSEVEIVRDVLIQINPAYKDLFSKNANRLSTRLGALDQRFREGTSACALRDIVVLHEAFSYLARQYKISATSIAGISPDEEPSPRELARITELVRAKGIRYIFSETVASPKFSELIAREIGGATLVLNPIESLTPNEVQLEEDYVSIMEKNLGNLQIAMSCN